jgi:hypothetical protein
VPFEMLTKTEATLTTFTGRTETHGKAKVPAVSFRLRFSGPNTLLDKLSKTAREAFYMATPGQDNIEGVELTTPHLRSRDITAWSPENAYEGWTVTIDRTGNQEDDIELGGCKVDGFVCELHDDPGNVDIECRVGTHHLTPDEAGYLWSKQSHKVFVMLAAPLTTQTNPDAGVERDPNQLTLDADGNELREPSDARQAADAAFAGEPQRGDDWPFPQGHASDFAPVWPEPKKHEDATDAVLDDVAKNGPGDTATPIRYQDADKPSRTWTGLGKQPTWLKQALARGKKLADFEVKGH